MSIMMVNPFWSATVAPVTAFVGTITAPNGTGSSATTGVGFQPGLVMMLSSATTVSTTLAGRLSFGAGTSSSARVCASTYSRSAVGFSETSHVTKTDYLMSVPTGGGTDTANDKLDLVSLDSDGLTVTYPSNINTEQFAYMALKGGNYKVGSFSLNTSTGAQAVTGVGFLPKVILLFTSTPNTTLTGQPTGYFSIGSGVSSSERCSHAVFDGDNQDIMNGTGYYSDSHIYTEISASAVVAQADLTSMDSDGFTLNVQTTDGTARTICYVAIGGISNAKIGRASSKTSTGNLAVTGVGFQPVAVIFLSNRLLAADLDTVTLSNLNGETLGIGLAVSSSQRATAEFCSSSGFNTSGADAILSNATAMAFTNSGAVTLLAADLVTMDSDGFTLNWTTVEAANARQYHYIAIR